MLAITLGKAITNAWYTEGIDDAFKALWSPTDTSRYLSLNDDGAAPGTPQPYCVWEQIQGSVLSRMTGPPNAKYVMREVPIRFTVHAQPYTPSNLSSKEIAATLGQRILKVYGGHDTQAPSTLEFDSGGLINFQFQNDLFIRTGEDEHAYQIDYLAIVDNVVRK